METGRVYLWQGTILYWESVPSISSTTYHRSYPSPLFPLFCHSHVFLCRCLVDGLFKIFNMRNASDKSCFVSTVSSLLSQQWQQPGSNHKRPIFDPADIKQVQHKSNKSNHGGEMNGMLNICRHQLSASRPPTQWQYSSRRNFGRMAMRKENVWNSLETVCRHAISVKLGRNSASLPNCWCS